MHPYVALLRPQQWYKNLVIFAALFFTNSLFNPPLLAKTLTGFLCLCGVSSAYYIVNDVVDLDKDKKHPEKRKRPVAAGQVPINAALALAVALAVVSTFTAYNLSYGFFAFAASLLASGLVYTFLFRDVAIIDIHFIAFNFLLRTYSGAVLISVPASPWLIVTVFFLALLLAVGKRRADLNLLGPDAVEHKRVYELYTKGVLDMMLTVISLSAALIVHTGTVGSPDLLTW